VDPPEADRLARCVGWLLADPSARAQARIAGPELIRTRFGLQRMINETVQAYDLRRVTSGESRRGDAASLGPTVGTAASQSLSA
jgi:hypothetical protein